MAEFLADKGIASVEFFHDGPDRGKIGEVLRNTGLEGIYIAVIPSKEEQLWLCDPDPMCRAQAVDMLKDRLNEARDNGMERVMINSGRSVADVDKGLEALAASVADLYEHAEKINFPLRLCLEPCDSWMDARHLVGPYARAVSFVKTVRGRGYPLTLTMDSAHTVEEGEDFRAAVMAAKPYCNHIHFANCQIADPLDPLYGDKHLGFEFPNTPWTPATLADLFAELETIYPCSEELRIALEVLCRGDDPYVYFEKMWASLPFLGNG